MNQSQKFTMNLIHAQPTHSISGIQASQIKVTAANTIYLIEVLLEKDLWSTSSQTTQ